MDVSLLEKNAALPIYARESESVRDEIWLFPKAHASILVTELGISTEVIWLWLKAPCQISVTEFGITTEVSFLL